LKRLGCRLAQRDGPRGSESSLGGNGYGKPKMGKHAGVAVAVAILVTTEECNEEVHGSMPRL
jgi:hypothetical protein